jgi:nucleoside-diphosphate-sugar epimerase
MRIAVIGATGHIGTWLVPMLVARGHAVVAISRSLRQPYHRFQGWDEAEVVHADRTTLENEGRFGRFIATLSCDIVIDLICFDAGSASQIVEALHDRVSLFVHCGTLWVHGDPPRRPYDETSPREPFGDYGIRKAEIERYLLEKAAHGFPATILHPGHITGPGWNPINPAGNLDPGVFDTLREGLQLTLPGDGSATLQHVHAEDVARAFDLAVMNGTAAIGESFHVAAREPVTMRDYAEQAARWYGREADLRFLPFDEWSETVTERDAWLTRDHILHSPHASIAKAERLLGFAPRYSAVEACRAAVSGKGF